MPEYCLVIGNKNYSSWSLRPWIWLKQAGIPFSEKRVSLFIDATRDELEPYFSNYKVPILKHGELLVWDTIAILEYLAEQHPEARGWPVDPEARALARSMSAEMHSSFTALRSAMPMNCRKTFPGFEYAEDVQADINRVVALWEHCRRRFGSLGPWLFGEFSIVDAMYIPVALRFHGYDVLLPGIGRNYVETVLGSSHVQDWIAAGSAETEVIVQDEVTGGSPSVA